MHASRSSTAAGFLPPADRLLVAATLTGSGGFLDAFTYVGHGHVFANSMTGNVVLLGLAAAGGQMSQAARHLTPIAAFLAGVFAAHLIRLGFAGPSTERAQRVSLRLEIVFLGLASMLPRNFPDQIIVLGISFVAAVQSALFTRVRGEAYTSTITTGNLKRFAEALYAGTVPRFDRNALDQAVTIGTICLSFLAGAVAGGVATPRFGNLALIAPTISLGTALLLTRGGPVRHRSIG